MVRHVSHSHRRRTLALLAVPLIAAGCGSSSSGGTSTDDDGGKAATTPALSEQEYQALVDDAEAAVSKSLSSVRGAGTRKGLQSRLESSAEDVEKSVAELDSAKPPASVTGHDDTVAALKGYSTALATAQGKVQSGGLCTAPAVLAQLTRSGAASDLRASSSGVKASGLKRTAMPALRLKSGMVLSRKGGTGPGVLVIKNGNSREGVVKLVGGGKRMSIYVGRKGTATVQGIPDGNFEVYFASGVSWDGKRNTFSRNCGFTK